MEFWTRRSDVDFLGFTHEGYSDRGVAHRRCFLVHREAGWAVVLDDLTSTRLRTFDWNLNTPIALKKTKDGGTAKGFSVRDAYPDEIAGIEKKTVRMALPIEGSTTWGVKRPKGTNLYLRKRGRQVRFAVLLASGRQAEASGIRAERVSGTKYGMKIEVRQGKALVALEVNCRSGSIDNSSR